jgi:hypothetical protein
MDSKLRCQAERLLSHAEEAMNPRENGLLDRGDFVRLVEKFCVMTKMFLSDRSDDERVKNELSKRLQRSMGSDDSIHPPN